MPFYVRVVNGNVTDVWDSPPPYYQSGWKEAIEIKPPINDSRQEYGNHYIDITKTPVEIVWPVKERLLKDRVVELKDKINDLKLGFTSRQLGLEMSPDLNLQFDFPSTDAYYIMVDEKLAELRKTTITHEEVDVLAAWWKTKFEELQTFTAPVNNLSL
jgi:hypothetical protein